MVATALLIASLIDPGTAALSISSLSTVSSISPVIQQRPTRDAALSKAAESRRAALDHAASSEARKKLGAATEAVILKLADGDTTDASTAARTAVDAQFPTLATPQATLATFYVLANVARITANEDTLNKRAAYTTKNGIHDLRKEQVTRLIHLMDSGSRFSQALGDAMKNAASVPDAAFKDLR